MSLKWRLWCQNDTPSGTAFSFKGERNIAHLLSFVQEIHAFDRRNWLRIRPKVRFWGCGISGLGPEWAREYGLQDIKVRVGEGSFRCRWTYEFWDDNVCKWGCKYLHPGLQIFASDAPVLVDGVLSIWESIRKHPFYRAGMLATDIFSAWDSGFMRLDAPFWCFSASVGCSCSLPWFVLTHSEEMFE